MKNNKPRVIVCQHGARRRYAIARMLEEKRMLTALYTDSSSISTLGRISKGLGQIAPESLQRLSNRKIVGVSSDKIFSTDKLYIKEVWQIITGTLPTGINLFHQRHKLLSKQMKKWGLSEANTVYSMYHENLDFVRWAKSHGAKIIIDVYISPQTENIMQIEESRFPAWASSISLNELKLSEELWQQTAQVADALICPSDWVANGVIESSPEATSKVRIVPYGASIDYKDRTNKPIKGRVLFVGGDALRKGLHYLAEASSKLKSEIPELDIRIAGKLPNKVVNHPICKDLNFLGKLTSEQMKEEYLAADVFILPSLSEGFAGVVAEAIRAGCPVIVTKESGSPVVNEREGLVILARDSIAIVKAITRIITDRNFRNSCYENSIKQSSFYSEQEWKKRLLKTIEEIFYV